MRFILLTLLLSTLFAGDEVLTPDPVKPVDLNKIVLLQAVNGIPGYVSPDGLVFTSVHGAKRLLNNQESRVAAAQIRLPLWLARRPNKTAMESLTPEQRDFWTTVSTEAAISTPLLNKQFAIEQAVVTAAAASANLQAAIGKEIDKANAANDRAALSPAAGRSRAARMERAQADIDRAAKALVTWQASPEYSLAVDSERRLAVMWAAKLGAGK